MRGTRFFMTISFLFSAILLNSIEWVDFGVGGRENQQAEVEMISNNEIQFNIYGMFRNQITTEGNSYDQVFLPDPFGKSIDKGYPELPTKAFYIEVTTQNPDITIIRFRLYNSGKL